jgi:division protein CdvB (Snf7/Vps24/ESCRT-III family)
MTGFFKNWTKHNHKSIREKVKETLSTNGPLKPRIEIGNRNLELQILKLDNKIADAKEREVYLFNRVVNAVQSHDSISAKVLSTELAEIRKNQRILNQARRTLEQVAIRNSTIHDLIEVMETLEPAIDPIKGLKSNIGRLEPNTKAEINYMRTITDSILSDSNQNGEMNVDIVNIKSGSKTDIDQIIIEASDSAEQQQQQISNKTFSNSYTLQSNK